MYRDDINDKKNEGTEWLMTQSRIVETGEIISTVWKRSALEKRGLI